MARKPAETSNDPNADFAYDGPVAGAPVPIPSTRDIGRPTMPSKATLENVESFVVCHQASAARNLMNLGIITQMKWHPDCATRGTDFSYTAILPSVQVWHALSDQRHPLAHLESGSPSPDGLESPQIDEPVPIPPSLEAEVQMLTADFESCVSQVRINVTFPDGSLGLCGEHVHMHFDEKYKTLTVNGKYGLVVPVLDGEALSEPLGGVVLGK